MHLKGASWLERDEGDATGVISNKQKTQTINIYLDDSGNLAENEFVCCFAGVVFLSNEDRMNFINRYRGAVNKIKASYDQDIEIKSSTVKLVHRRQLLNLIYKQLTFGVVINNQQLNKVNFKSKFSVGKYEHFAQKLAIKSLIKELISTGRIDPNHDIEVTINSDQHTTATDGIYDLRNSVFNELKHGTKNYDMGLFFHPIVFGNLNVTVNYFNSRDNYGVQASDILAGEIRKKHIDARFSFDESTELMRSKMTCLLKLP